MRHLLNAMLSSGALGFGGGSAMIPLIEDQVVTKHSLVDRETFNRQVVVVNITPGAQPPKLGALAGLQTGGITAAVLAALAVSIPGVLGTLLLLSIGGSSNLIERASVGISVVIITMMLAYVARVLSASGPRRRTFWLIIAGTVCVSGLANIVSLVETLSETSFNLSIPRLSTVQVIVAALTIIVLASLRQGAHPTQLRFADLRRYLLAAGVLLGLAIVGILVCLVVLGTDGLALGGRLALSAVTSFGGGPAYLGVAAGYFVDTGMVSDDVFYTQLVPVASALPGPILVKIAAGVAFVLGSEHSVISAWVLGFSGMLIVSGACIAVLLPIYGSYDQLTDHPVFQNISNYMLAVICGLLINTSITMLRVSTDIGVAAGHSPLIVAGLSLLGIWVCYFLRHRKLAPDILLILACAVIAVLVV